MINETQELFETCPKCGYEDWASDEIWIASWYGGGKVVCPECGHVFVSSNVQDGTKAREIADRKAARLRRSAEQAGALRRGMRALMGRARFARYLEGLTPDKDTAGKILDRLKGALAAGCFDSALVMIGRLEALSFSRDVAALAQPIDQANSFSTLKGVDLQELISTPGEGVDHMKAAYEMGRAEEMVQESFLGAVTVSRRTFPVSAEIEGIETADENFYRWARELAQADGLEETEPPEDARLRRFFMGETTERVDLIVFDSQGNEKRRFALEGVRCTDSPLQRLSRGEPPFETIEDGAITVQPVQATFLRPFERSSDRVGKIVHTEGVLKPPKGFDDEGGDDE